MVSSDVLVAAPFAHLQRQMGSDVMYLKKQQKGRKDIPWYNKEMVQGSSSRKCITL